MTPGDHARREGPPSVLVVDDDAVQLKLAQLTLAAEGFTVLTAASGAEAIRVALERRPDVVLSDVLMPEMDGFQLCAAIRQHPALATTPVVLMSAHYIEDRDRELALRFGANRYVCRSDGVSALIAEVFAALDAQPGAQQGPTPEETVRTEYMKRLAHQLERQTAMGAGLARRAALQTTALSVLGDISEAISRQAAPEQSLIETLTRCLDAAGLSVGAIFLRTGRGDVSVVAQVGAPGADNLWGQSALLERVLAGETFVLPSQEAGAAGDAILADVSLGSAILVPIVARDEVLGALALGSHHAYFTTSDGNLLARSMRALSTQLGQALALSRTFARLAESEQRYRTLFECAHDTVSVVSPDGVILEMNHRWEEILGVPRQHLLGRHVSEFWPPELAQSNRDAFLVAAEGAGSAAALTTLLRPDGRLLYMEFSRSIVEIEGRRQVFSIGRDVTSRVTLEAQYRQSQKMEAVGRLAGGVAHDMNNVLAVVLANVSFLLDSIPVSDPMRADADEIRKAAERGANLTRQLLAFSRQQVLQPRVLVLNDVIRDMANMLRTLIGEDVRVELALAPDLGRVRVDPGQIEQVIMNLAINARDAMPEGGTLRIATANDGASVRLEVRDTGVGMDDATRQRIFEPFFTTKEKGKGTGLGLSTVLGVVEQSDGAIEVDTGPGRGTAFLLSFPRVDEPAARPDEPATPSIPAGGEVVLLVEDEPQLRAVLARFLRHKGYAVLDAATPDAAIAASDAREGPIHLVLSDIVMPGMRGNQVAAIVRRRHPEARVLFMSGYTESSVIREIREGAMAFLQKPFSLSALSEKINEVLNEVA